MRGHGWPSGWSLLLHRVFARRGRGVWAVLVAGALGGCGSGWSQVESGTDRTLHAVWAGTGSDEAWAVGEEGTILRFGGGAWRSAAGGEPDRVFTAVVGLEPGVACVVDEDGKTVSIWKDGGAPQPIVAFPDLFLGLWVERSEEGPRGPSGQAPTSEADSRPGARDVWVAYVVNRPDGFAHERPAGAVRFRRGDDGAWRRVDGVEPPPFVRARPEGGWLRLHVLGPGEVWALDLEGHPVRFDAKAWRAVAPLHEGHSDSMTGLGSAGPGAVWAVGGYGRDYMGRKQGYIARFDGTRWTLLEKRLENLNAVAGAGPDEAFAVGHGGTIVRYRRR